MPGKMYRSRRMAFFVCIFCMQMNVMASGSIGLQFSQDSTQVRYQQLDLDSDVSKHDALQVEVGHLSSADASDLDVDHWQIGVTHKFSDTLSVAAHAGFLGKQNDIEINRYGVDINWNRGDWWFGVLPEYADITLFVNPRFGVSRQYETSSTRLGISVAYTGIRDWEMGLDLSATNYEKDPTVLASRLASAVLSSKALLVSSGLEKNSVAVHVTRQFESSDLTLSLNRLKSAVDQEYTDVASMNWMLYSLDPYILSLEVGVMNSQALDTSEYGMIEVRYAW